MNNNRSRNQIVLAAAAMLAMVPFNMGGCSDVAGSLGGAQGNQITSLVSGGVKEAKTETLNESDERGMGESVAMAVTAKYPIVSDMKLNQYVTLVGLTLAGRTDRPDRNWLFAVVDTQEVNAFSGPDGYIFVTRGAIMKMHDESELAGVIGHEMTHVLKQHGLEAVKREGRKDAAMTLGQGFKQTAPFSQLAGGAADVTLVRGYDRGEEDEADGGGVKLITAAGYDPHGYLRFIQRIGQDQGKGGGALFPTHPGAADRAAKIKKQIDAMNPPPAGATLADRFAKMTNKGS